MNFKVVYSDETKRLPAIPESFASLREAIKSAFKDSLVTDFVVQYKDNVDTDFKVIHSEGDFQQLVQDTQKNGQSSIKVFVQAAMYPVFNDEPEVKNAEVQDEQEKPAKKEKREKNSKKEQSAAPVSEAEAAIRAELVKKQEEKKAKRKQVEELRGEAFQIKETLTFLQMKKLENKGKLISLQKTKIHDESLTKEEAAKLRKSKILLRDELKPIKQEIHDLKSKVHGIQNQVRELQGKEPKARTELPSKGKGRERKCEKRIDLAENLEELEEVASPTTPGAPVAFDKQRVNTMAEIFPQVSKKQIRELLRSNPTISDEQLAASLIQA